jgi:hypothetical protein
VVSCRTVCKAEKGVQKDKRNQRQAKVISRGCLAQQYYEPHYTPTYMLLYYSWNLHGFKIEIPHRGIWHPLSTASHVRPTL